MGLFHDDNVPIQTAQGVIEWIDEFENYVNHHPPAQSPDLKLIYYIREIWEHSVETLEPRCTEDVLVVHVGPTAYHVYVCSSFKILTRSKATVCFMKTMVTLLHRNHIIKYSLSSHLQSYLSQFHSD